MAKKNKGVEINLKESKKSVEQALRELKMIMQDDIDKLKENRYRVRPTAQRRERAKQKRANINRYNKYN